MGRRRRKLVVVSWNLFIFLWALRLVGRRQKGKKAKGKAIMCFPLALVTQRAGKIRSSSQNAWKRPERSPCCCCSRFNFQLDNFFSSVSAMTPGGGIEPRPIKTSSHDSTTGVTDASRLVALAPALVQLVVTSQLRRRTSRGKV